MRTVGELPAPAEKLRECSSDTSIGQRRCTSSWRGTVVYSGACACMIGLPGSRIPVFMTEFVLLKAFIFSLLPELVFRLAINTVPGRCRLCQRVFVVHTDEVYGGRRDSRHETTTHITLAFTRGLHLYPWQRACSPSAAVTGASRCATAFARTCATATTLALLSQMAVRYLLTAEWEELLSAGCECGKLQLSGARPNILRCIPAT